MSRLVPSLLIAAGLAGMASPTIAAPAATITITESSRSGAATGGPWFVPNQSYTESFVLGLAGEVNSDSFVCDSATNPCFEVQVEVDLPADYAVRHPTDTIRVNGSWDPQASDLDMHVYVPPYDTASGSAFRVSRNNPPTPEVVEFPVVSGRSSYRVFLVPAAPAAASATITVSLVTGPTPNGDTTVELGGPKFANYRPPAGLTTRGEDVSEPTMGVDIGTNKAYMLFTFDVMEAGFDDSTTPATATWRNLGTGGAVTTADPFMTMSQHPLPDGSANHRVWIAQLLAASSYMAHNDSTGTSTTWTRSLTGPGQVHGVDNQSIAAGPYPGNRKPPTAAPTSTYPQALYYCSHEAVNAFCSRSDDGGLTFNPSRPIFGIADNCNNHGHVKVGSDGTVYVPMNNSCQGHQGVSVSVDAGETWHFLTVPGTVNGRWDSTIAVANDGRTIYYGYGEAGDDRAMVIKGTLDKSDPGAPVIHWQQPAVDVGAPAGIVNMVFGAMVAGEPDRAAFAFHGTTTEGDSGDMATFPAGAEWYLWVATTIDGGRTWKLSNATPGDPTQKGSICDRGTLCDNTPDDRNLLDFMDADIDGEGRVLVGYADGCVDSCVTGGPNSFTARGYIARQVDGPRLIAAFDPPPPSDEPGKPALGGTRDGQGVRLAWTAPSPGSSAITSYVVARSDDNATWRTVATTTGVATKHDDTTAIDVGVAYRYRVAAVNASGTGPASDPLTPTLSAESVCGVPGLSVLADKTGDSFNVVNVAGTGAPTPDTADLVLLTVGEPYMGGGEPVLVFQLKTNASRGTLLPDSTWFVSFRNAAGVAYGVRMVTDAAGNPRFESYKVAASQNGSARGDFVEGTPKAALGGSMYAPVSGVITIIVRASDVGVAGGSSISQVLAISSKYVGATSPLTGSFAGLSQPFDMMPDSGVGTASVKTEPVAVCGPNAAPLPVLAATPIGHPKFMNVRLDASRSYDPDASATDPALRDSVVKYVFDFGDGSAPVSSSAPVVDHQYPEGGQFKATVRVQDSRGKASTFAAGKQLCRHCFK